MLHSGLTDEQRNAFQPKRKGRNSWPLCQLCTQRDLVQTTVTVCEEEGSLDDADCKHGCVWVPRSQGGAGVENDVCFHLNLVFFIRISVRHLTDDVFHFE